MKKFFALMIGLIIFSVTNFVSAAHYYVASYVFEGVTETFYVDSDKLEIIYLDNGQLHSSKNKNIINSTGVLFKVGYVRVTKNHQGKEFPYTYDVCFYRKFENNLYSVFNDLEVNSITHRIKLKREVDEISEENIEKNGLRWLTFWGTGYHDDSIESPDSEMACLSSVYKKARELFGVQNNYDISLRNFNVLKIDLGYYQGSYDGRNFHIGNRINNFVSTRAGIPEGIFQCYLLPESVIGEKNNFSCTLRIERDEGPEVIFGNEKYNFVNRNGEIFYKTSNNGNLEKIKTSDCAYNLYQEAIKKL